MARNRLTIIACLLALVAWGQIQYRATLFGHLAAPATPLVVDGSVIVMMGTTVLQGASLEDPAVVLWSFNLDESFCCSAGNDTNCGPVPAFQVIRGRGTVLVGCGPYLAVLNTTTGANMSAWYTIPEGDLLSQFAVVSSTEVTVVSLQSCRVFALNISTWDLLWQVNTSAVSQPLVATADNGLAVVFSFASAYRGTVDGYSVVKGTHLWSLTVGMWSTQQIPNNPWQSDTVFVWCGPEFATVRMLHVPTGAYHQWISDTMVQFAAPTSAGLVVAVTLTHVTVLNASNGAVLWSVRPGSNIAYARVSYGGQYVTVYPPEAVRDHVPTTVYAIADGTVVGNCGYGHCSEPCVTQAMRCGTVAVVAMCNASNSTSAVLALLDLRTSRDTALDGAPIRVTSSSPVAPVSVQALTEDGLVAVTTATGLRYLQLSSLNGMSSPNQFVPSLEAPSFDPRFVVSSIGAAFVVSIAAGVAAVRRQRERRRAVAVAEEQLVVAAIAATSRVEVAESITYDRPSTSYTVPPS